MRFEGLGRADGQLAGWAYGDVAELADALDLGSSLARGAGSTPVIPI